jgi:hypothetical protein
MYRYLFMFIIIPLPVPASKVCPVFFVAALIQEFFGIITYRYLATTVKYSSSGIALLYRFRKFSMSTNAFNAFHYLPCNRILTICYMGSLPFCPQPFKVVGILSDPNFERDSDPYRYPTHSRCYHVKEAVFRIRIRI